MTETQKKAKTISYLQKYIAFWQEVLNDIINYKN